MRTIKRQSLPLNTAKRTALEHLSIAYRNEKRYWLNLLQSWDYQALLGTREVRDRFVKDQYHSRYGLQARHWKLALEDATATWDKYWQSLFVQVRRKVFHKKLTEEERHYAYWLLKGYKQFAGLMQGEIPEPSFPLPTKAKVANYLRKTIKKYRKRPPTVKIARSIKFDPNCYEHYHHEDREYIKVMSNELIKDKNINLLITEDLSHTFTYDKPKSINRKLSFWIRGTLQDRIRFKALAEGFRHEQVNPAYGSQACPYCDFVDTRNRKLDKFKCLHCGHEDYSDRVAAVNYAKRYADGDIGQYMPYCQVKAHLLAKFHRRLEAEQSATVPGRTLDAVTDVHPPQRSRLNITAGRNRTATQRAKQNEYV